MSDTNPIRRTVVLPAAYCFIEGDEGDEKFTPDYCNTDLGSRNEELLRWLLERPDRRRYISVINSDHIEVMKIGFTKNIFFPKDLQKASQFRQDFFGFIVHKMMEIKNIAFLRDFNDLTLMGYIAKEPVLLPTLQQLASVHVSAQTLLSFLPKVNIERMIYQNMLPIAWPDAIFEDLLTLVEYVRITKN